MNEVLVHGGFHANSSHLVRTTYFTGNELWMTNSAGVNSGYGTDENGNMIHFVKNGNEKIVDYVVEKGKENWTNPEEDGMEGYYITLKDVVASNSHAWTLNSSIYTSSNKDVIDWFKAICAPCYIGFNTETNNYINFSHVEIKETNNQLELSLYANSNEYEKLSSSDSIDSTPDVFAKAVIITSNIPNENKVVKILKNTCFL